MSRYLLLPSLLALLAGCASAPEQRTAPIEPVAVTGRATEAKPVAPGPVSVTAERIKANEQLFKTTVETGSDTVKSVFTTSSTAPATDLTRLESSWTRRLNEGAAQLRLGDTISMPGNGGNPLRFAGVQLGSSLDLRDDIIASSRLAAPGIAALPSSVDALLSSTNSPDSHLARQGLSVQGRVQVVGANSVKFVTRDSLGRTLQVTQPLMTAIHLTEPGCGNYAMDLGRVRKDYAIKSNEYGEWLTNVRVVCGMPLGLTLEGHGEYLNRQGSSVGIGLARSLSSLGKASVGLASSQDADSSGWLARLSFEHSNPLFDLNVRTLVQSPGFQRVGTGTSSDPTLRSTVASLGMNTGDASNLAVVYATETTLSDVTAALVALTQRMRFGAFNSVTMTAGQSLAATARVMSVYLSFTRAFGTRTQRSSGLPDTIDLIRLPRLTPE